MPSSPAQTPTCGIALTGRVRLRSREAETLSHRRAYGRDVPAPPAFAVPLGLDSCRALWAYDEGARRAVVGLKNRDERGRISELAASLARLVPAEPGLLVTWAPTS